MMVDSNVDMGGSPLSDGWFGRNWGGWLVWQWLREEKSAWLGLFGVVVLIAYGVIPTLQNEPAFGRVYAAYGGVFIVLSLMWGRWVDDWRPDRYDILGAVVALIGVAIILWGRRLFSA